MNLTTLVECPNLPDWLSKGHYWIDLPNYKMCMKCGEKENK
jgi:hypothetical protein